MFVLSASFSNAKTKSLFAPWKFGSTKWFRFRFWADNSSFDRFLFQQMALLKTDFDCVNNFALTWVDKVTTGTKRLASVFADLGTWFAASV